MCFLCFLYRYLLIFDWNITKSDGVIYKLISNVFFLVELFFFLSGFFSYMKYQENISSGVVTLGTYMKKKIRKLYPLMILTALVCSAIQILNLILVGDIGFTNTISLSGIILSCLGLQTGYFNDGGIYSNPTEWYLSILMLCYLLSWFICRIKDAEFRTLVLIVWAVLGCALILNPLDWCFLYAANGRGYFGFAAGALFAQLFKGFQEEGRRLRVAYSIFALALVASIWSRFSEFMGSIHIVMVILVCPAVVVFSVESHVSRFFLKNRVLQFYGKISYSLYLWSFPFDVAMWGMLHAAGWPELFGTVWVWLTHILLMTAIAYVSWYIFERKERRS